MERLARGGAVEGDRAVGTAGWSCVQQHHACRATGARERCDTSMVGPGACAGRPHEGPRGRTPVHRPGRHAGDAHRASRRISAASTGNSSASASADPSSKSSNSNPGATVHPHSTASSDRLRRLPYPGGHDGLRRFAIEAYGRHAQPMQPERAAVVVVPDLVRPRRDARRSTSRPAADSESRWRPDARGRREG